MQKGNDMKFLKSVLLIILLINFTNCFGASAASAAAAKFLQQVFLLNYLSCNVFKGGFCYTFGAPAPVSNKLTVCTKCDPMCKMQTDFTAGPTNGYNTCTTGHQEENKGASGWVTVNIDTAKLGAGAKYDSSKCVRWVTSDIGTAGAQACGVHLSDTSNVHCYIEGCTEKKEIDIVPKMLGYDLTASDPPVGVKSINPSSSQIIYENQNINIQFAGSVKSDSIALSGSMNSELNPNFRFGRTVDYNDTLPLAASSKWSLGAAKTLTISALDINDNPVAVPLLYHVIQAGSSKTPSFNDCSGGCKPGWQNAYSIQFNATGGVPPYRWAAASSLPPEANVPSGSLPPGASMTQDGLLSGPATNNFMPNAIYVFGVAVIDSVGQIDVKIITIDTTDVGAQIAACLLLGLCG